MTDELTQEELRWLVDHKEEIIHQLNVENDDLRKQLEVAVYEAKIANDGFATIERQDTILRAKLDEAVDRTEKALVHIPEFSPAYNYLQDALALLESRDA